MNKKVTISPRPTKEQAADTWVEKRQTEKKEGTDRLTIDIPVSLHRRIKAKCALEGRKMAHVIRELLEERFPA